MPLAGDDRAIKFDGAVLRRRSRRTSELGYELYAQLHVGDRRASTRNWLQLLDVYGSVTVVQPSRWRPPWAR